MQRVCRVPYNNEGFDQKEKRFTKDPYSLASERVAQKVSILNCFIRSFHWLFKKKKKQILFYTRVLPSFSTSE